ncbi:MAG: circularly permuted type 2 ATP-grasp protein [Rhodococcus sp. (in: high G+C Gram-positive bacteria)]
MAQATMSGVPESGPSAQNDSNAVDVRAEGAADPEGLLGRYTDAVSGTDHHDELIADDASIRPQWSDLVSAVSQQGRSAFDRIQQRVGGLVDDHGITYNTMPSSGASGAAAATTVRWELDSLPYVVSAADWERLEAGMLQRSRLLDLVLTDVYGDLDLVRRGVLPPELVFGNPAYIRRAHGITVPGPHQLFFHATDVARFADGEFRALTDRTQAPSGAGYALAGRTVMSRAMPELFEKTSPRQLSTFARAMRLALVEAAPEFVDDPLVVVLSPGVLSETAFDQAHLASVLGFPLVESADLVVRDGSLWMRALGTLRRVDVVVRRVDDSYADPLDLRSDSQLGVVGLIEVLRRGVVTVVNTIGSGVLENPALFPLLPTLCRALLGEDLLLPSIETFWAGDPSALSHIRANMDSLLLRSTDSREARVGSAMSQSDQEQLLARIEAEPWAWSAQHRPKLATSPVGPTGSRRSTDVAVPGSVSLRLFDVAQRVGYTPMYGGLAQVLVSDPSIDPLLSTAAKDIWVRSEQRATPADADIAFVPAQAEVLPRYAAARVEGVTSPRVLSDLFWLGRYSERAESMARLLVAAGYRFQEYHSKPWLEGYGALTVLLEAVNAVSATGVGFRGTSSRDQVIAEFRSLTLDACRQGSLAQSVDACQNAARAVRDQLSVDTWAVFSRLDNALARLAAAQPMDEATLWATQDRIVGSTLAVSGLAAESMVRDPGWFVMDVGKRIERGLQLTKLMSVTATTARIPAIESVLIESVLGATESSVTYGRRHHGRIRLAAVADLLLFDGGNPRSLVYQLDRALDGLGRLPGATGTSRPEALVERMIARLRRVDPGDLETVDSSGTRSELDDLLEAIHASLIELADLIARSHLTVPGGTQPLWGSGGGRILT